MSSRFTLMVKALSIKNSYKSERGLILLPISLDPKKIKRRDAATGRLKVLTIKSLRLHVSATAFRKWALINNDDKKTNHIFLPSCLQKSKCLIFMLSYK